MDESTTRVAAKATRMMVLYRLRTERRLAGLSDIQLAKAFGVRRETIWRDRQALQAADDLYAQVAPRLPWNELLTVAEAAERLHCNEATIRAMMRHGIIRAEESEEGLPRYLIPIAEVRRLWR